MKSIMPPANEKRIHDGLESLVNALSPGNATTQQKQAALKRAKGILDDAGTFRRGQLIHPSSNDFIFPVRVVKQVQG